MFDFHTRTLLRSRPVESQVGARGRTLTGGPLSGVYRISARVLKVRPHTKSWGGGGGGGGDSPLQADIRKVGGGGGGSPLQVRCTKRVGGGGDQSASGPIPLFGTQKIRYR